jgi:hypothetical protein
MGGSAHHGGREHGAENWIVSNVDYMRPIGVLKPVKDGELGRRRRNMVKSLKLEAVWRRPPIGGPSH